MLNSINIILLILSIKLSETFCSLCLLISCLIYLSIILYQKFFSLSKNFSYSFLYNISISKNNKMLLYIFYDIYLLYILFLYIFQVQLMFFYTYYLTNNQMVESRGLEPLTPTLQAWCSPN